MIASKIGFAGAKTISKGSSAPGAATPKVTPLYVKTPELIEHLRSAGGGLLLRLRAGGDWAAEAYSRRRGRRRSHLREARPATTSRAGLAPEARPVRGWVWFDSALAPPSFYTWPCRLALSEIGGA